MRLSLPSFAAGALAATMLIALPSNAGVGERKAAADPHPRAYDGSSPSLTMNRVSFIVGSTIDAADAPGPNICPPRPWNMSVPLRMSWTASDAVSGVAGYDVWIVGPQHVPPEKLVNQTQSKHFDYTGTNYSGDCGGGQEVDNDYWVVATDNRGNTSRPVGSRSTSTSGRRTASTPAAASRASRSPAPDGREPRAPATTPAGSSTR